MLEDSRTRSESRQRADKSLRQPYMTARSPRRSTSLWQASSLRASFHVYSIPRLFVFRVCASGPRKRARSERPNAYDDREHHRHPSWAAEFEAHVWDALEVRHIGKPSLGELSIMHAKQSPFAPVAVC